MAIGRRNDRLSPWSVWHIVKRLARQAEAADPKFLGLARALHTHDTRHHFARTVLNNGANLSVVQDLLGHASPATTKRIYATSDRATLRTAARRMRHEYPFTTDSVVGATSGARLCRPIGGLGLATTPIARLVTLARWSRRKRCKVGHAELTAVVPRGGHPDRDPFELDIRVRADHLVAGRRIFPKRDPTLGVVGYWIIGAIAALLFVSVLIHELAHSWLLEPAA